MSILRHITALFVLAVLLFVSSEAVNAASVQISLSPSNPGVGDQVYLKIKVVNSNATPSQPSSVPGFKLLYFTMSQSGSSMYSDGHNTTSSTFREYTATLRAVKEGRYTFGPIVVGGVKSNVVKYSIGKKSVSNSHRSNSNVGNPYAAQYAPVLAKSGGNDLFLRAEVSNPNPYEQEPVVYTIKMYSSYDGTQVLGSPSAPSFENCTYEISDAVDHEMHREVINGKTYSTAVLMRYILFPTHPGKASIKGNTISFSVKQLLEYDDGSNYRIPTYQRGQTEATAPTVTLNVKPLPQSDSRISGVGIFKVKSVITKRKLTANQVATVKYIVSGNGNLAFVSLPDISSQLPQELKFVKSESKINKKITADNMTGTVEFTVNFIPTKDGEVELPDIDFCFYNPSSNKIYNVKAAGCVFTVGKQSDSSDDKEVLSFINKLQSPSELSAKPTFTIDDRYYYLYFIVPLGLLIISLIVYRRRLHISADVVGLRRKKACKIAKSRLKKSAYYMRHKKSELFYAETLKAMWGYIAHKLDIPVSELSRDNITEQLINHSVTESLIGKVIDIIDRCEFARYTNSDSVDMHSLYNDATAAINELESNISVIANVDETNPDLSQNNNSIES